MWTWGGGLPTVLDMVVDATLLAIDCLLAPSAPLRPVGPLRDMADLSKAAALTLALVPPVARLDARFSSFSAWNRIIHCTYSTTYPISISYCSRKPEPQQCLPYAMQPCLNGFRLRVFVYVPNWGFTIRRSSSHQKFETLRSRMCMKRVHL